MVQYFAEQLDGFATTELGWVQSYGSRCVRPPILYGDVSRPAPMTVAWASYAQSLTGRPVKGMLTGPVTILAWSFVRDDQPLADTADQVALALRDEIDDLECGRHPDRPGRRAGAARAAAAARGAIARPTSTGRSASFRLATGGAPATVQIHTHLCYSEFGEVIAGDRRARRRRHHHRGGPVPDGGAGRPGRDRVPPRCRTGRLRHPLAAGAATWTRLAGLLDGGARRRCRRTGCG